MPSIDEAFQRSKREKEQVEECKFIIELFLSLTLLLFKIHICAINLMFTVY